MPKSVALAGLLAAMALSASAVAADYRPPRTASGAPDLQGLWSVNSRTKLERPDVYPSLVITEAQERTIPQPPVYVGDDVGQEETEWMDPGFVLGRIRGEIRTSWLVDPLDGRLPYTETGAKLVSRSYTSDGPETRSANDRCLPFMSAGPPMFNAGGGNVWKIVQTPDHVVVMLEGNHEIRIIPLVRKDAPTPTRPPDWLGHPVAWYVGDELVVRTTAFHPGQSLRRSTFARLYLSSDAVVTERFRRISANQILYSYVVHDPKVFHRDWRGEMPLNATAGPLYEYACHEGNYSMAGILGGARVEERAAEDAAR
jgi:hypothetical protein